MGPGSGSTTFAPAARHRRPDDTVSPGRRSGQDSADSPGAPPDTWTKPISAGSYTVGFGHGKTTGAADTVCEGVAALFPRRVALLSTPPRQDGFRHRRCWIMVALADRAGRRDKAPGPPARYSTGVVAPQPPRGGPRANRPARHRRGDRAAAGRHDQQATLQGTTHCSPRPPERRIVEQWRPLLKRGMEFQRVGPR